MESPEEFWQRCCDALDPPAGERGYTVRQIGYTPEMVDLILGLIIAGQKRGTFSLPEALERAGTAPIEGDYIILTRNDGTAACLVVVDACDVVPFDRIGPPELEIEGPGARDPAVWREIHERWWKPIVEGWGRTFSPSEPVLVQRFRLLKVAADAD